MDQNLERRKSRSKSERDKKDKKKKKKHHDDKGRSRSHQKDKDRSRSHHKKKKNHTSPDRLQRNKEIQPQIKEDKPQVKQKAKQVEVVSPMKDEREQSEKKKKRKDSRDSERKKKKKKEKKEKRDRSPSERSRSREKRKKKDYRDDRDYRRKDDHRRDRRKRSYDRRYDSPGRNSESEIKEDPQQLQKLSQLKAAKELVSSKADRKLYLGNLPPNITSQQLMEMLNSALKKMDINTDVEGDSIVSAWISPDGVGHYAFVEFRTAQQATNGLTLNGASLFGYQLKLGRPKQYIEYNKALLSEIGTDKNMDTIIKKVATLGKSQLPPVEEKIVTPPSRIVVLKHIVSIQELGIDEEFNEILEDVKEMASRFGEVVDIMIPRPHEVIDLEAMPTRVKGLGLIFIEYKTVTDAKSARAKFVQKQFSGRPVACSFFDEKKFRVGEYDIQDKVIIDF